VESDELHDGFARPWKRGLRERFRQNRWILRSEVAPSERGGDPISRGIGGQFRITQRYSLSNLYKNSCCGVNKQYHLQSSGI
jgi:hypothetical protein